MTFEMNILEDTPKRLVFELKGAGHTLCNALKKELWKNKNVKVATYSIEHPLRGTPKVHVETDGEISSRKAIKDAIRKLADQAEKFKAEAKKL